MPQASDNSINPEDAAEEPASDLSGKAFQEQAAESSDVDVSSEPVTPVPSLNPINREPGKPFYRRNPLTVAFSILLIIIYGLTTFSTNFSGPPNLVVALGGFYPPAVQAGEWWRWITATLLHGSPAHLFNNVVGLLIFGNLLESIVGSWRLFLLYVLSVLGGLGFSYFFLPDGMTLGASTIDFGLIGAYLGLVLMLRYRYERQTFFREFRGALMFVLLFVGWNTLESATINLWAHIGGLLAGIIFALWIGLRGKRSALPKG